MTAQLPDGHNATIACGDWSGCGTLHDGASWDFETCTLLVETIGTNNQTDMFPSRPWTMDWMKAHCQARFGQTPQPTLLADEWGFGDLAAIGVTNIVFTNGLNDGWSAGSVLTNLSDTLLAVNMPNGAHHSDLTHTAASPMDTPDVAAGRLQVKAILHTWLADLRVEQVDT
jgi:hypothetical protein